MPTRIKRGAGDPLPPPGDLAQRVEDAADQPALNANRPAQTTAGSAAPTP